LSKALLGPGILDVSTRTDCKIAYRQQKTPLFLYIIELRWPSYWRFTGRCGL